MTSWSSWPVAAPTAIDGAMLEILRAGRTAGAIRTGIDLAMLAERVCQSMLHVGVGAFHSSARAKGVPTQKCRIFLHGVAVRPPSKSALDRSPAMRAAREGIAAWNGATEEDERVAHLRAAARAEFGRRGYEATTMRDISAAAGLSTASVYRMFGSKEDLLASIMHSFVENVTRGWDAVLESDSSALERLDTLMWVNTNLLDRFSEEFKIQLALLRQTPLTSLNLGRTFAKQQRQMKDLLADGTRAGEMRIEGASAEARVFSMMELVWMPPSIVQKAGSARRTRLHVTRCCGVRRSAPDPRTRVALARDSEPVADARDLVEDRGRHREGLGRRDLAEM